MWISLLILIIFTLVIPGSYGQIYNQSDEDILISHFNLTYHVCMRNGRRHLMHIKYLWTKITSCKQFIQSMISNNQACYHWTKDSMGKLAVSRAALYREIRLLSGVDADLKTIELLLSNANFSGQSFAAEHAQKSFDTSMCQNIEIHLKELVKMYDDKFLTIWATFRRRVNDFMENNRHRFSPTLDNMVPMDGLTLEQLNDVSLLIENRPCILGPFLYLSEVFLQKQAELDRKFEIVNAIMKEAVRTKFIDFALDYDYQLYDAHKRAHETAQQIDILRNVQACVSMHKPANNSERNTSDHNADAAVQDAISRRIDVLKMELDQEVNETIWLTDEYNKNKLSPRATAANIVSKFDEKLMRNIAKTKLNKRIVKQRWSERSADFVIFINESGVVHVPSSSDGCPIIQLMFK